MFAKKRQENKKTDNSRDGNRILRGGTYYNLHFTLITSYLYTLGTRAVMTQGTS